jgi:hypothetical protein
MAPYALRQGHTARFFLTRTVEYGLRPAKRMIGGRRGLKPFSARFPDPDIGIPQRPAVLPQEATGLS